MIEKQPPVSGLPLRGLSIKKDVPGIGDGTLRWAPQYDLRNCGPEMIRQAVQKLADHGWPPWFQERLAAESLSVGDVAAACEAFVVGFKAYVESPEVDLGEALHDAGFTQRPFALQALVAFVIGQIATGMIGFSLKAFTFEDDDRYVQALREVIASGEAAIRSLARPPRTSFDRVLAGLQLLEPASLKLEPVTKGGRFIGTPEVRLRVWTGDVNVAVKNQLEGLGWTVDQDGDAWLSEAL